MVPIHGGGTVHPLARQVQSQGFTEGWRSLLDLSLPEALAAHRRDPAHHTEVILRHILCTEAVRGCATHHLSPPSRSGNSAPVETMLCPNVEALTEGGQQTDHIGRPQWTATGVTAYLPPVRTRKNHHTYGCRGQHLIGAPTMGPEVAALVTETPQSDRPDGWPSALSVD